MWSPELEELGSINEYVNFSHEITYNYSLEEGDPLSVDISIVALDTNPTVVISSNIISGSYSDSFSSSIQYRTPDAKFITVSRFSEIDVSKLGEVISFKPSGQEYKVYNYVAIASYQGTVLSTKNYTKTVVNDWTSGRNSLVQYVGYTL